MSKMENYKVILTGGSIGTIHTSVGAEFDNKQDASDYAKRMNKILTKGEKSYYKMKYKIVKVK